MFFNCNSNVEYNVEEFYSFNSFVEKAGWTMSWIGNHGFWKDDFDSWKYIDKNIEIKFLQVDWLIRSFKKTNKGIICTSNLTYRLDTQSKQGDYNFFKIHTDNYFKLFAECVDEGYLSEKSFLSLKRKVLRGLLQWIYIFYIKRDGRYSYSYNDGIKHLYSIYKKYYWFYLEVIVSFLIFTAKQFRDWYRKIKKKSVKKY